LLGNLDFVLRHATRIAVSIADDPLSCVALGTGRGARGNEDAKKTY